MTAALTHRPVGDLFDEGLAADPPPAPGSNSLPGPVELPWPPSVNRYYRSWNPVIENLIAQAKRIRDKTIGVHLDTLQKARAPRVNLSKEARNWQTTAQLILRAHFRGLPCIEARMWIVVQAFPPDRRRRDVTNLIKAVPDAFEKAGVVRDDNQFKRVTLDDTDEVRPGGMVVVSVRRL